MSTEFPARRRGILLLALLLASAPLARAQRLAAPGTASGGDDAVASVSLSSHTGCHVPAKGKVRALVLFIQTREDPIPDANWPVGQLPTWTDRYVSDVRTYFSDMSGGQLELALDVYPKLLVTQGTEFDYLNQKRSLGDATRDLLRALDDSVDFGPYDQWQAEGRPYNVLPGPDRMVEVIIQVYRSFTDRRFFAYAGVSDLAFEGYLFVDGGARMIYGGTTEYADASASGLTVAAQAGSVTSEAWAYQITLHEFMHKLYGEGHPASIYGGLGLLSNAGGGVAMNSFERHELGYIVCKNIPPARDTVITLRDYVTTGEAATLAVPQAPSWFFNFEYRINKSAYDTAPGKGVYIYRIYDPFSKSQKEVRPINAGGYWQWAVDSSTGVPYRRTADPLRGYCPYDKVPIDGKPYYVDGWSGDPQSAFTLQRHSLNPWGNPTPDFIFNRDTVRTELYVSILAMTDSTATIQIRHGAPPILAIGRTGGAAAMALHAGYPNPVASGADAMIPFELAASGSVRVAVYDALGRAVATLADGFLEAGAHTVQFRTAGLPPGAYQCVLTSGAAILTHTLVVTR